MATRTRFDLDGPRLPDLPVPAGWFEVLFSEELAHEQVVPLRAFGRELVAWRGTDGIPRVWDAFCPHLGTHLGEGGTVVDKCLRCPLHGWSFDGDGRIREIPYTDHVHRTARPFRYPVEERFGGVFAWYHPRETEP